MRPFVLRAKVSPLGCSRPLQRAIVDFAADQPFAQARAKPRSTTASRSARARSSGSRSPTPRRCIKAVCWMWNFQKRRAFGGVRSSALIDLPPWFLGKFTDLRQMLQTGIWSADVEDNCFLALANIRRGGRVFLHATWTEWKNLFMV